MKKKLNRGTKTQDIDKGTFKMTHRDTLIDDEETKVEREIIAAYMKKAKDIYKYCNDKFTL